MADNVLIVGYGQVGRGIYGLYKDKEEFKVYYTGLTESSGEIDDLLKEDVNVMHVCIPYSHSFESDVTEYITKYSPKLTIINSTVPMGTTRTIYAMNSTSKDSELEFNEHIVHSPVMGVHPNLTKGIKTFKKIVGGCTNKAAHMATAHFESLGVKTLAYSNSDESEAAKLLSTSYYHWNVVFMKYIHKMCQEQDLNFQHVYQFTNEIYNEGYDELGMQFVKRPILKYMPGKTGGHCLIPNLKLIKNIFYPATVALELENASAQTH